MKGKKKDLKIIKVTIFNESFPSGSDGKESAYKAEDPSSIPGSGRSLKWQPTSASCLENLRDGEAWQTTVHGVAKCWT